MNTSPDKSSGPDLPNLTDGGFPATEVTNCQLSRNHPALFTMLATEYRRLVQKAAEKALCDADPGILREISALARRAGEYDAVPVDLITVHLTALATLANGKPLPVVNACVQRSRLLLLKMVGELALYYRSKVPLARAAAQ